MLPFLTSSQVMLVGAHLRVLGTERRHREAHPLQVPVVVRFRFPPISPGSRPSVRSAGHPSFYQDSLQSPFS